MKFYYNGELIRTSKNHLYTHAVLCFEDDGKIRVIGCASSYDLALKVWNRETSLASYIDETKRAIENAKDGKDYYKVKYGRTIITKTITHSIEEMEQKVERLEKSEQWMKDHYRIVELEKGE